MTKEPHGARASLSPNPLRSISVKSPCFRSAAEPLSDFCGKIPHRDGTAKKSIVDFPIPACHRPTAGLLQDGRILITCRLMQGGKGWLGAWTQNLLAVLTDRESVLADSRSGSRVRILPVDYDRSPFADTGYSGWVQFPDGGIYIVNYIVDDAYDKAQIRGYSLSLNDFILPEKEN